MPGAGAKANPFHHRSVSGSTCAFHHRIDVLSSGSPRSDGTTDLRWRISGKVRTTASAVYATAATANGERRYTGWLRVQSAGPRLLAREHRLIAIAVAVCDGAEQAVSIDVVHRHRDAGQIRRGSDEIGVFQANGDRRSHVVVCLIDHRLAVPFVRRRR